uniref:Uncharacterized protein n=1 Tax=Cucumis melo TaxID=3656 RepID=A0A9I9E570_CUCME
MSAPTGVYPRSSDRHRRISMNPTVAVTISHSHGACCTIHPSLYHAAALGRALLAVEEASILEQSDRGI